MNNREKDIPEMEQMANEGWQQMKELLRQEGLHDEKVVPLFYRKKFLRLCATLALLLAGFFIINRFQSPYSGNNKPGTTHSTLGNSIVAEKSKNAPEFNKIKDPQSKSRNGKKTFNKISLTDSRIKWTHSAKDDSKFLDSIIRTSVNLKEFGISKDDFLKSEIRPTKSDRLITPLTSSVSLTNPKSVQKSVAKKVIFYVGAASNISAINGNVSGGKLNIHPSIRIEIPLHKKLNLHSGLYAFSTIYSKEAKAEEKEEINNIGANLFYKIKTTSVIKATYIDVPVTLHYQLSGNWSIGAGVLFSKLLQADVKEKEESFDYSNNLIDETTIRYNSNEPLLGASSPQKVDIKGFDPRISLEGNFKKGPWLFSAGYYYGLNKTITLQESNGDKIKYRNQYLKFGVQFLLNKKK